jgi:transcriptional regulator with XRE-family HTH domain
MIKLRVKEILKDKGMTVKGLAEKLGMTDIGLHKALSDEGNPPLKKLEQMANIFNVPITELFDKNTGNSDFTALINDNGKLYKAATLNELAEIVEKLRKEKEE